MKTEEKAFYLLLAVVIALMAGAVFWLIAGGFAADQRDDRLQERCIEVGGNWNSGCELKP